MRRISRSMCESASCAISHAPCFTVVSPMFPARRREPGPQGPRRARRALPLCQRRRRLLLGVLVLLLGDARRRLCLRCRGNWRQARRRRRRRARPWMVGLLHRRGVGDQTRGALFAAGLRKLRRRRRRGDAHARIYAGRLERCLRDLRRRRALLMEKDLDTERARRDKTAPGRSSPGRGNLMFLCVFRIQGHLISVSPVYFRVVYFFPSLLYSTIVLLFDSLFL